MATVFTVMFDLQNSGDHLIYAFLTGVVKDTVSQVGKQVLCDKSTLTFQYPQTSGYRLLQCTKGFMSLQHNLMYATFGCIFQLAKAHTVEDLLTSQTVTMNPESAQYACLHQ